MGLPEIFIAFQTAAATAISRSARGAVVLVVNDDTAGGQAQTTYQSVGEVDKTTLSAANYRVVRLAFLGAPTKITVLRAAATTVETLAALNRLRFDWLAAPGLDNGEVVSYIQSQRAMGRGIKAVVANATAPDCEGIVNLCAADLTLEDGAISAGDYTGRVAGLLAALPLTRSATYVPLAEVRSCAAVDDADGAVDDGKLILVPGSDGHRLGRAVNSLTTLTTDKGAPFQKIKIVEGIDLIRADITRAFESSYIGKVLNDYDSKLLLVTAINAYFDSLAGDVLDKTAENLCGISLEGQKAWLKSHGTDTTDMKDLEILKANTGAEVFLSAALTFCDAMEDLSLRISM